MLSAPFHSTNSSLLYVSFLIETNKITSLFKKAEEKFLDFSSAFLFQNQKLINGGNRTSSFGNKPKFSKN
ncbi:hypothetical protein DSH61_06060 [Enterococcus faecalis]|nr:hypothetical protein [Enterococcus faecalis]EGO8712189.1 hypothetical protein [Enterococcus faecalis]EGO8856018.1 hypothetical protein [Enterococcus faecalis]EGO8939734.1 hypothetical protein [Enterococcus faecalis]EGO9038553.1 hypothetical protein [Enterococcus faecalis]